MINCIDPVIVKILHNKKCLLNRKNFPKNSYLIKMFYVIALDVYIVYELVMFDVAFDVFYVSYSIVGCFSILHVVQVL